MENEFDPEKDGKKVFSFLPQNVLAGTDDICRIHASHNNTPSEETTMRSLRLEQVHHASSIQDNRGRTIGWSKSIWEREDGQLSVTVQMTRNGELFGPAQCGIHVDSIEEGWALADKKIAAGIKRAKQKHG